MFRKYSTIILLIGLAVLLSILGVMQYRWQTQISGNERERMHKLAQETASRFADDFNKQIQNAYFNFQVDGKQWREKNYRPFAERYNFWREKTKYPELISDFYFFDAAGASDPLRYNTAAGEFIPLDWTPELHNIFQRASDNKDFRAVYDEYYTLILPEQDEPKKLRSIVLRATNGEEVHPREPEPVNEPTTIGYLAIRLDPSVIKDKLLPDLAAADFGDSDFRLSVADAQNQTVFKTGDVGPSPDAEAQLFQLSPTDIFFFANRDLLKSIGEKKDDIAISSHVESRTLTRTEVNGESKGTVKVEVQNDGEAKSRIFSARTEDTGGHWTLAAQHAAGSIDAYVANNRTRNLGIGFGILTLLGLSVAGIIFSAQRAKAFAQRQIDFVSSVSHEFRTPLAVIYSAGENLADGVTSNPSETSKYGELIKGEGHKLSAMVEQVLEFAGANSGRRKFNFRETSVSTVIDNAVTECMPLIRDNQMDVRTEIDPQLPFIDADSEALTRAVQNLVANAVKYRNGNGWLRIAANNGDNTVKISVEDRGIGISKSDLGQIFEPFYRSKDVVDAQIHGNGLGLALAKQIAEAHGGRVTVESELGVGSKFTIEIPAY